MLAPKGSFRALVLLPRGGAARLPNLVEFFQRCAGSFKRVVARLSRVTECCFRSAFV